jgi:hypothetical protein
LQLNTAQFSQNTASQNYPSATIPGRTQTVSWKNPKEIKNPPRSGVHQYNGVQSNATINAKIDKQLTQAGDKLTITGSVGKLCSTCNGWIYTCEAFEQMTCDVDDSRWNLKCKYKSCPADLPNRIHAEGEKTETKIFNIISDVITVASIAVMLFPGIGAAIGLGKNAAVKAAEEAVKKAVTEAAKKAAEEASKKLAEEAAKEFAQKALYAGLFVRGLQGVEQCGVCFSVCGTQYETNAGNAPICAKGLGRAEVPIAYKNATYSCPEGYCEMWTNKKVKIEIRDPDGNVVKTDTTTTDAYGQFSYTFIAPHADGEFIVIVSVPKDW